MFIFIALLLDQYQISLAIQFDSGSISSGVNQKQTNTILQTFSTPFTNEPEIIIMGVLYNYQVPIDYSVSVIDITKTNFKVVITSFTNFIISGLDFKWIAIDDKRIQIFNYFNLNLENIGTKNYTISHNNINANRGFISLVNYCFNQNFFFQLKLFQVTANDFTYGIIQNTTNVKNVSFQIIIGTQEAMEVNPVKTLFNLQLANASSYVNLNNKPGYTLFLPLQGMSFQVFQENQRLNQQIIINNNSTTSYVIWAWYITKVAQVDYQEVWLNQCNLKVIQPLLLKKMRVSKAFRMDLDQFPIKLKINGQVYTSSQDIFIESSIQILDLEVNFQCSVGRLIQGQLLLCTNCSAQNDKVLKIWNQFCYNKINFVSHLIRFQKQKDVNYKVSLEVTQSGFTITQQVINQSVQTYTVLKINIY